MILETVREQNNDVAEGLSDDPFKFVCSFICVQKTESKTPVVLICRVMLFFTIPFQCLLSLLDVNESWVAMVFTRKVFSMPLSTTAPVSFHGSLHTSLLYPLKNFI